MIRAKGHFWIATRPQWVAEFSLAGALSSVAPLGGWWASVPQERWPTDPMSLSHVNDHWVDPWGDRRQELVFIGSGMDQAAITAALDACLLQTDAFTPDDWADLPDPFPKWGAQAAA